MGSCISWKSSNHKTIGVSNCQIQYLNLPLRKWICDSLVSLEFGQHLKMSDWNRSKHWSIVLSCWQFSHQRWWHTHTHTHTTHKDRYIIWIVSTNNNDRISMDVTHNHRYWQPPLLGFNPSKIQFLLGSSLRDWWNARTFPESTGTGPNPFNLLNIIVVRNQK